MSLPGLMKTIFRTTGLGLIRNILGGEHTGDELVINGGFDQDSDWVKGVGWAISGGLASCDGSQVSTSNMQQVCSFSDGTMYSSTIDLVVVSGSLSVLIGNGSVDATYTSSGKKTTSATANGASPDFLLYNASSDFVGSIDNISVKRLIT